MTAHYYYPDFKDNTMTVQKRLKVSLSQMIWAWKIRIEMENCLPHIYSFTKYFLSVGKILELTLVSWQYKKKIVGESWYLNVILPVPLLNIHKCRLSGHERLEYFKRGRLWGIREKEPESLDNTLSKFAENGSSRGKRWRLL